MVQSYLRLGEEMQQLASRTCSRCKHDRVLRGNCVPLAGKTGPIGDKLELFRFCKLLRPNVRGEGEEEDKDTEELIDRTSRWNLTNLTNLSFGAHCETCINLNIDYLLLQERFEQ